MSPILPYNRSLAGSSILITALLSGCSLLPGGDSAGPPEQPPLEGSPAVSVTIVLPDDIYRQMPAAVPAGHPVTEAQLDWIETYALGLTAGERNDVDERVNDCRFEARQACVIRSVTAP